MPRAALAVAAASLSSRPSTSASSSCQRSPHLPRRVCCASCSMHTDTAAATRAWICSWLSFGPALLCMDTGGGRAVGRPCPAAGAAGGLTGGMQQSAHPPACRRTLAEVKSSGRSTPSRSTGPSTPAARLCRPWLTPVTASASSAPAACTRASLGRVTASARAALMPTRMAGPAAWRSRKPSASAASARTWSARWWRSRAEARSTPSSCASLASSLHRCLQMRERQANTCCSCSGSRSRPGGEEEGRRSEAQPPGAHGCTWRARLPCSSPPCVPAAYGWRTRIHQVGQRVQHAVEEE